jgi:glycosyltransferase involved in cell wall biosynthesis
VNTIKIAPQVTVIALCFNHAKFLHECLESIAAQTVQDFQLIITDDCSKDDSPDLIQAWITQHRPDAIVIRHAKNMGLCKTLNEALSHARGEFISMIATDDAWEPNKIERQLAVMRETSASVAVVYSDASRMDEAGRQIETNFIEAHTPDCTRPSGQIFSELANRNFIPAMATLIRRQALLDVGLYDEQLTYEDYDMWLRLAARYEFVYCPATLARYRIVSTSIVRTVFARPTAQHHYTLYLICKKWLPSDFLNPAQHDAWADRMWGAAYGLYSLDDARATICLWQAVRYSHRPRAMLLAVASTLGISRSLAMRLTSFYRKA